MIIDFSVENFKSIKEEQTFSMAAAKLRDEHNENIIHYEKDDIYLLKSAAIYGANASGKSNLLEALLALQNFITKSTDLKMEEPIPYYRPYRLDKTYLNKPTKFEIEFIATDNIRYNYTFIFNEKEIESEELFFYPKNQKSLLFSRKKGENIRYGSQLKGKKKNIESQLLPNNLFLSKAANSNHEQLGLIYVYFLRNLIFQMNSSSRDNLFLNIITRLKQDNIRFKDNLIKFLRSADTGIFSTGLKEDNSVINKIKIPDKIPETIKRQILEDLSFKPVTYHKFFDGDREEGVVDFDLSEESNGTIKMYGLAEEIIPVLENGYTLIVDELDSSFHPLLSEYITELFNSPEKNPNNSQFIFTTHDTSILTSSLFRRDQIWFTKKNTCGATELFSLDEFDKDQVRKNTPFNEWYIKGRFGAIPRINKNLFNITKKDKK